MNDRLVVTYRRWKFLMCFDANIYLRIEVIQYFPDNDDI